MKIEISEAANGYVVRASDTIKKNGSYIFRSVDILTMIEFIGEIVLDKKISVTEK
jgi:hypothetical protein